MLTNEKIWFFSADCRSGTKFLCRLSPRESEPSLFPEDRKTHDFPLYANIQPPHHKPFLSFTNLSIKTPKKIDRWADKQTADLIFRDTLIGTSPVSSLCQSANCKSELVWLSTFNVKRMSRLNSQLIWRTRRLLSPTRINSFLCLSFRSWVSKG